MLEKAKKGVKSKSTNPVTKWLYIILSIAITLAIVYLFFIFSQILASLTSMVTQGVPSYLPHQEPTCFDNKALSTPISFTLSCKNPSKLNYLKVGNALLCGLTLKSEKYDNVSVRLRGYYTSPSGKVKYFIGNDTYWTSVQLDKKSTNYELEELSEVGSYRVRFEIFPENESCTATINDYFDVFSLSDVAQYEINAKIGLVLVITALVTLISTIPSFLGYVEKIWENIREK